VRYFAEQVPFHFHEGLIRSQTWPLFRAYRAIHVSLHKQEREGTLGEAAACAAKLTPQPRLAIPAWMAPLMRFALPSAPHARESISRITENRDRSGVFLALDLSAFSVSHALDGFLLAKHRRFVSPDRHSWDFSPSELFPHVQPWRLPALVALMSL
jgi:hypothetical protein